MIHDPNGIDSKKFFFKKNGKVRPILIGQKQHLVNNKLEQRPNAEHPKLGLKVHPVLTLDFVL